MTTVAARIRAIPSWQITLGVALLALGFLMAAQFLAEGPRVRYTTQERSVLVETALGLQSQQDQLKARIVSLRQDIGDLEQQGAGATTTIHDLNDRLGEARDAAGLSRMRGTGIVVRIEDSTTPVPPGGNDADYLANAADLRTVVGLLWQSGAEALAINGERITTTSSIIDIGGSVLVNQAYLTGPYDVTAIGAKDLFAKLSATTGWGEFVQTRRGSFGIGISWAEPDEVELPAFAGSVTLRESRAVASPTPVPGSEAPGSPAGSAPAESAP